MIDAYKPMHEINADLAPTGADTVDLGGIGVNRSQLEKLSNEYFPDRSNRPTYVGAVAKMDGTLEVISTFQGNGPRIWSPLGKIIDKKLWSDYVKEAGGVAMVSMSYHSFMGQAEDNLRSVVGPLNGWSYPIINLPYGQRREGVAGPYHAKVMRKGSEEKVAFNL
jgi:hypothetical protein